MDHNHDPDSTLQWWEPLVFCIGHISLMVVLRKLVYGLLGQGYDFGPLAHQFYMNTAKMSGVICFYLRLFQLGAFCLSPLKR